MSALHGELLRLFQSALLGGASTSLVMRRCDAMKAADMLKLSPKRRWLSFSEERRLSLICYAYCFQRRCELPNSLSSDQLRTLAREGARVRLQELRAEIASLETLIRDGGAAATRTERPAPRGGRRRALSAAGRAAIAAGQKARWQKVKAANSGTGRGGDTAVTATAPPARKRSRMSAAARKAVGERMRKYWAARRKQAATKPARGTASKG